MVKPVREGRRCWVLDYADGAQFHMDVVPLSLTLPSNVYYLRLMATISNGPRQQWSLLISNLLFTVLSDNWRRSNPKGYAEWFKMRMRDVFEQRRKMLAESIKASVEEIPDYKVRTPLQSAIMILKRHRDGMFEKRYDERPISIIITTLAAVLIMVK
jgi:hypothetical protein